MMTHMFRIGDRVQNGAAKATVVSLVADDALGVIYDGNAETVIEVASYFRWIGLADLKNQTDTDKPRPRMGG